MNNPDLNIDLLEQLPPWYREVLDYQEICQTEQQELDALAREINVVADNFFFQTMKLSAVEMWEKVLGIVPSPETEDLAFRRFRVLNRISSRPPYTMAFLSQKLDEIIGPGNWTVRMDYANYTLYIESSAENQLYAGELYITFGKIKPAHIVYINTPLLQSGLALSETISKSLTQWNYRLGSWALYSAPFRTTYQEEVIKVPSTPSIQPLLLSDVASFVSSDVVSARLNGSILISALSKTVSGNILTVTYDVAATQAAEITRVELLNKDGNPIAATDVYIPVGNDGIQMKHTIPVYENGPSYPIIDGNVVKY